MLTAALAAIGVYGLLAWTVSERRRKLAIRLALGAQPGALARLVTAQGLILAGLGVAAGGVGRFVVKAATAHLPPVILTPRSMEVQPHVPGRHSGGVLPRDALISCVAVLLVFAAFDDITTDKSAHFTVEYSALVVCAVWFGFVAVRLIRLGRRRIGVLSLVALLAAPWAQRGIGPGITPGLWPEYVVIIGVFLWFLALAATRVVLAWQGVPRPTISRQ